MGVRGRKRRSGEIWGRSIDLWGSVFRSVGGGFLMRKEEEEDDKTRVTSLGTRTWWGLMGVEWEQQRVLRSKEKKT